MSDSMILSLYITGIWVFIAPELQPKTRRLAAFACTVAAIAVSIRIVLKIVS